MFAESADQRAVICPYLELLNTCQVIVAFLYGVYDRQALQFNGAVSGLCGRQRRASALYDGQSFFVLLDQGEADAV